MELVFPLLISVLCAFLILDLSDMLLHILGGKCLFRIALSLFLLSSQFNHGLSIFKRRLWAWRKGSEGAGLADEA